MRYIRSSFSQMKSWQQRLVIVLAILVVLASIGTLTMGLLHLRERGLGNSSEMFQSRRGWTQIATYTGTGSKTITTSAIALPQLWGYSLICEGADVDGEVTGRDSAGEKAIYESSRIFLKPF